MSFLDKLKNKAQQTKGRSEETAGRRTGDPYLEREGKADRFEGGAKQVGERAKDAVKDVRKMFGR
jgi:uncharacterized protein YjbJ (UPF0337 family)